MNAHMQLEVIWKPIRSHNKDHLLMQQSFEYNVIGPMLCRWVNKVETPIHDIDLILIPIIAPQFKVVDNELEVAWNFTWAVLGMEDGNF
jgi:hypothetical protein